MKVKVVPTKTDDKVTSKLTSRGTKFKIDRGKVLELSLTRKVESKLKTKKYQIRPDEKKNEIKKTLQVSRSESLAPQVSQPSSIK